MTKDVGQIKDIIYNQSISKIFEDVIIGEHDALQIISFSSVTVKFKGASLLPLPICITVFTVKTCKLSHTFRFISLIIPFDRGRVYY